VCLALSLCLFKELRRGQPHGSGGCQLCLAAKKVIVVHDTGPGHKELGDLKDMGGGWDIF